jgi:hypothetical protein
MAGMIKCNKCKHWSRHTFFIGEAIRSNGEDIEFEGYIKLNRQDEGVGKLLMKLKEVPGDIVDIQGDICCSKCKSGFWCI